MKNIGASEFSEFTVSVVIDGKVTEVPIAELANGYLRQADYTQKTTEVANQRKEFEASTARWNAFAQRLTEDPKGVILDIAARAYGKSDTAEAGRLLATELSEKYGPQRGNRPGSQGNDFDLDDDNGSGPMNIEDSPLVATLVGQVEKLAQQIAQMQADSTVNSALSGLASTHSDFEELRPEVLKFAHEKKITDLEAAYWAVKGQKGAEAKGSSLQPATLDELLSMGGVEEDAEFTTLSVLTDGEKEGRTSDPSSAIAQALTEVLNGN